MALLALAAGGVGLGAGALMTDPDQNVQAESGSNVTVAPSTGNPSNGGLFGGIGDAFGDIIKILGPLLLIQMIGGFGGSGGGLFGMNRGSSTSAATSPVIVIEDDD